MGGTGITSCLPVAPPPSDERNASTESGLNKTEGLSAAENELTLYPNPSNGTVLYGKMAVADDKILSVKIYDAVGKEVFSQQVSVSNGEFSLSFADNNLQHGIYMLVSISKDTQYTQKIIVK